MVLKENINIDREAIAEFCRRHHIRKLSLFGSVLTDRFRPDSDVDVLVEFEPGAVVGFDYVKIERELGVLLGRTVDMGTPDGLSKYVRDRVLASAQLIYGS